MNDRPDKWVVIKISKEDDPIYPIYKLFSTWLGGYLDGDAWKMNSGIVSVEPKGDYLQFFGHSGSCYECPPSEHTYGTNSYTQGVLNGIIEKGTAAGYSLEVLPPDTDWLNLIEKEDEKI